MLFLCVYLCVCLFVCQSVCLSVFLSVYLFIYLSLHFYNTSFWPLFSNYNFDLAQIQILFFGVRDIMLETCIGSLTWRYCRKKFVIRNYNMLSLQLSKINYQNVKDNVGLIVRLSFLQMA